MFTLFDERNDVSRIRIAIAGLTTLGISVSPFAGCGGDESTGEVKQPNIIFIMSDDHDQRAISCYDNGGETVIETPNIDRIANEGMRFDNSFVTNSVCAPSRAVMLTGKYSHLNGKKDNLDTFDSSQDTFTKTLSSNGYQTAVIGKWHLESDPVGFDTYQILSDSGGQGVYYNPSFNENGEIVNREGYVTDIITDKAIEFLDSATKSDKPFCMLMHHKAPHRNWMPAPRHFDAFDGVTFPLPQTFYDDYSTREMIQYSDMKIENMYLSQDMKLIEQYYGEESGTGGKASWTGVGDGWQATLDSLNAEQRAAWDSYYLPINQQYAEAALSGNDLTEWKYQRYMQDYLGCVLSLDESIGEVLDYLDEHNLAKNTIVVYTSDQGFYTGQHGWFDKRWMYETSFRMPLVMRYPAKVKAGSVSKDFVLNLDFAPTFLDYCCVAPFEGIQGESLRGILEGKTPSDWRTSVYYHFYADNDWHGVAKHYGIRTNKYKLINFYNESYMELFDLENDPNELNNVYENSQYSDIATQLETELKALRKELKDETY